MEEKKIIVENYEINPYTIMIKPGENTYSEVYELDGEYLTPSKPLEIVKQGCAYFGSSLKGRHDGTKMLINVSIKAPIIVDPHSSIYLFPTTSPTHPQCIWIAHDHIISHRKESAYSTIVTFQNKQDFEIPISFASFENQLSRTARLRIKYEHNTKRMENYGEASIDTFYFKAAEQKRNYRARK